MVYFIQILKLEKIKIWTFWIGQPKFGLLYPPILIPVKECRFDASNEYDNLSIRVPVTFVVVGLVFDYICAVKDWFICHKLTKINDWSNIVLEQKRQCGYLWIYCDVLTKWIRDVDGERSSERVIYIEH